MNISRQLEVFFHRTPCCENIQPEGGFFLSLLTIFYELEGLKISLQIFFSEFKRIKK